MSQLYSTGFKGPLAFGSLMYSRVRAFLASGVGWCFSAAVGFGGVWPRSSSPVLGLLGWDSGFVGWGGGGVAGDSMAPLSGMLSTRYYYSLRFMFSSICLHVVTFM